MKRVECAGQPMAVNTPLGEQLWYDTGKRVSPERMRVVRLTQTMAFYGNHRQREEARKRFPGLVQEIAEELNVHPGEGGQAGVDEHGIVGVTTPYYLEKEPGEVAGITDIEVERPKTGEEKP